MGTIIWQTCVSPNDQPFLTLGDTIFLLCLYSMVRAWRERQKRQCGRVTGFLFLAVLLIMAWLATVLFRGSVLALSLSSTPEIFALLLPRAGAETGRDQLSPLLRDQSR